MKKDDQHVQKKLEGEKKSIWKIDKQTLPYKVHYFIFTGAMGAFLPYVPSIGITRLRLGAGNLAIVFTLQQFLIMIFKPIIGYLADYFNNLKGMIVALATINGVLTFILLALPKVKEFNNNSQLIKQPAHTLFCNLCPVSDEWKTTIDYLSILPEEYQKEISCSQENTELENFAGYCPTNSNLSIKFNIKLEVKIKTCYSTKLKLEQLNNGEVEAPNEKFTAIFIKMYHHWMSPELDIVCPDIKNSFEFQISNLTLNNLGNFCFKHPEEKNASDDAGVDKIPRLSKNFVCNDSDVTESGDAMNTNTLKTYQFWLFTLISTICVTSVTSIFTLSDTACSEAVHITGAEFGKQRAWGAVGWGLFAPFAGFLNDYTDDYWAATILMSLLSVISIWNLNKINLVKPHSSQSILKDIKTILSSIEFVAFEAAIFVNGIGIGIVWCFLAWFITDIGGSRLLIGLVHTVQCFLGEMPFMFFSGLLIRKIGHFNVVNLALFAHGIRFLAYSSLKNPWMILPIEMLDGITFGAFFSALTSYGKQNAKPGTEATTQSLLCATYQGLGAGMGCIIGGACFDHFGGYTTFFYGGLVFVGAAALNVTSTILLHYKKRSELISTKTTDALRY